MCVYSCFFCCCCLFVSFFETRQPMLAFSLCIENDFELLILPVPPEITSMYTWCYIYNTHLCTICMCVFTSVNMCVFWGVHAYVYTWMEARKQLGYYVFIFIYFFVSHCYNSSLSCFGLPSGANCLWWLSPRKTIYLQAVLVNALQARHEIASKKSIALVFLLV